MMDKCIHTLQSEMIPNTHPAPIPKCPKPSLHLLDPITPLLFLLVFPLFLARHPPLWSESQRIGKHFLVPMQAVCRHADLHSARDGVSLDCGAGRRYDALLRS